MNINVLYKTFTSEGSEMRWFKSDMLLTEQNTNIEVSTSMALRNAISYNHPHSPHSEH